MNICPRDMDPERRKRLMGSVVVPRPIAFVSTVSVEGTRNLAPYALFGLLCYHPVPLVAFTPMHKRGGRRTDTLVNVAATGEFVIGMVTEDILDQMNVASAFYPPDVDEFDISGLTALPAHLVKAPLVRESPVNMECRVTEIIEFGKPQVSGEMVMGEVLLVHIWDSIYRDQTVDSPALHAVGRMGEGCYTKTRDILYLKPPPD